MRSSKHAKHAKPAFHPTRTTLSTGLTAVLLPLCLASPAFASGEPAPAQTSATSTVGMQPRPSATPSAEPAPVAKQQTTMRISGPRGTVAPGKHPVGVRLLADGKAVKNGYVRIEKATGSGWEFAGRLLTDANGLGVGTFAFTATTRVRASYQGAATRTAGESSEIRVDVSKAASFRQRALQVVAAQKGKPYRWGSTGPSSFDCSGLMVYTFKQVGKNLPRTSQQQLKATQRISKSAKQPGDLIFTQRNGRIGHVGVYAGNGSFWVAPKAGDVVKLQKIYTSTYSVGRVV